MAHLIHSTNPSQSGHGTGGVNRRSAIGIGVGGADLEHLVQLFDSVGRDLPLPCLVQTSAGADEIERFLSSVRERCQLPAALASDGRSAPERGVVVAPELHQMRLSLGLMRLNRVNRFEPVLDRFYASLASSLGPAARCILIDPEGLEGAVGLHIVGRTGGEAYVSGKLGAAGKRAIGPWVAAEPVEALAERLAKMKPCLPTTYYRSA